MVNKEPAVIFNGISEILRQLIPLLIVFGFIHWTDVQIAAAFAFSSVLLTVLTTWLTRTQTTPTEQVDKLIRTATDQPAGTPVTVVKDIQAAKDS